MRSGSYLTASIGFHALRSMNGAEPSFDYDAAISRDDSVLDWNSDHDSFGMDDDNAMEEWQFPESVRSQNPSPQIQSIVVETMDDRGSFSLVHRQHLHDFNQQLGRRQKRVDLSDSETEDIDTSSVSSQSPTSSSGADHSVRARPMTNRRDSVAESQESDSLSPQHVVRGDDPLYAMEHIDENDENEEDRNVMEYNHEFQDGEEETSDDGTVTFDERKESEDLKDRQIERLQLELKHMSAQMIALMESVEELRSQNEHLEASKVNLITTTAKAMDECRNTVRDLSRQNLHLLQLLSSSQKT